MNNLTLLEYPKSIGTGDREHHRTHWQASKENSENIYAAFLYTNKCEGLDPKNLQVLNIILW